MKIAHRYGLIPKLDICGILAIPLLFIFVAAIVWDWGTQAADWMGHALKAAFIALLLTGCATTQDRIDELTQIAKTRCEMDGRTYAVSSQTWNNKNRSGLVVGVCE